ncbi:AIPR protein/abortive infection phage resistance-like protein [Sphingomonas sp. F9_3S_D5_B_2]
MEAADLEASYSEFNEELLLEAEASSEPTRSAFFRMYSELAADNGDCIDLQYTPVRREGRGAYQIDGYALDAERKILYLAICDFRQSSDLEVLNAQQIEDYMKKARRFVELAFDATFINELEETSPSFEAAYAIYSQPSAIRRIRVVLFSNARLSTRRPPEAADEIAGRSAVYNYFDFRRYAEILGSRGAPEPIEIDFTALGSEPLPCLPASGGNAAFESYLAAIPGSLLAKIYGLYGARLLEQNVRTFLQARTKVNRGIITTARENPERFFAYNNGITATASGIRRGRTADGAVALEAIQDLQIVNGGQTTASILYAQDQVSADLSEVFVQMKLTVVRPDLIEEIVPKISRYANTQNKISEADFFSSHPFHVAMEQMSRRLAAPPKPGAMTGTKWFYERARGQYKDASAYGTPAEKRRFSLEFPKAQVFDKTDLAKYQLTFDGEPHVVSQGAQKCFLTFAEQVAKDWETSSLRFNEVWFRNTASKALIFRWTDHMVGQSEWYREDRGYKAQTVTYTLAWLQNRIRRSGKAGINLQLVWNSQEVPEELRVIIEQAAPAVAKAIRDTPPTVKNVGEYCKQQACWATVSRLELPLAHLPDSVLLDHEDAKEAIKAASSVRKMDLEIELDTLLVRLAPKAQALATGAKRKGLLSPRSDAALNKVAKGHFNLVRSEKAALTHLLARLAEEGVDLDQFLS